MWTYQQTNGWLLRPDGTLLGRGYSGRGNGKNNPDWQKIEDAGPIPAGVYRIGDPVNHPLLGEYVLPLTPDAANQMFDRSDFFIHGDSIVEPGNASKGCIVTALQYRQKIVESGDHGLEVVPGWAVSA
jgi:hypothetical protein